MKNNEFKEFLEPFLIDKIKNDYTEKFNRIMVEKIYFFCMNTQEYLEKIRSIQNNLLCFLDDLENVEENYQNLLATLEDLHVHDDKNELATFLHLILTLIFYEPFKID